MADRGGTPVKTLLRGAEIGREEGLRFVYAGNLPGRVGEWEDTRCPGCGVAVVTRVGFRVERQTLGKDGRCPGCGTAVPGIWAVGARPIPQVVASRREPVSAVTSPLSD